MSQNSPDDQLDRLLSDFFKAQLKNPWPAAPETAPMSTPSTSVATAAPEPPRNKPTTRGRDPGMKARYTLAASVAMLLGTCWYLSNGFQPGERVGPGTPNGVIAPDVFPGAGASDPAALQELRKDNAEKGNKGIVPPMADFKFE